MKRLMLIAMLIWCCGSRPGSAEEQKQVAAPVPVLDVESSKLPTFINSQTLTLLTEERRFIYTGGVDVTQGDLKIVSKELEGTYDENNKIEGLVAKTGVIITKGEKLRATSERATYDTKANTVVLTESPRLEQEGSILTADLIRVFLKDNRSVAEGNVKVTLVNKGGEIDKATQGIAR